MAPGPSILNPFRGSSSEDNDPKYKHLAGSIDRALATWDHVQEWADYISFIGKLQKAFRNYNGKKNIEIPSAHLVSRRLAQCIDPDLPYGVHQKTLELYRTIFELQGPDHLSPSIWLPGLLPLMAFASMNVKPILIALIQKYILPLASLRSILQALLLALLPGIDDESSESFNDVFALIENIQLKINDDAHFWQCMFTVIIKSSDRRLGALAWLSRKLPRFSVTQINTAPGADSVDSIKNRSDAYKVLAYEAQMAITTEPGLLIRAFCCGLNDDQQLVQRGFLELLVKNLELQSPVLQVVVSKDDLKMLILSACGTVLRKDMSLNRRLWNWLLGPEPDVAQANSVGNDAASKSISKGMSRAEYFQKYGHDSLSEGLIDLIRSDTSDPTEKSRPYKICLSILDRWEISTAVVPCVLLPIVQSVKDFNAKSDADFEEVLRSASSFFDAVEPHAIWSDCFRLITGPSPNLSLLSYILQMFNVEDEEMVLTHLPLMFLTMTIVKLQDAELSSNEATENWLKICTAIIELIPTRAFSAIDLDILEAETPAAPELLAKIREMYNISSDDDVKVPFDTTTLTNYMLKGIIEVASKLEPTSGEFLELVASLIVKIPASSTSWRSDKFVKLLQSINLTSKPSFSLVSGSVSLFDAIYNTLSDIEKRELIMVYCLHLFNFLAESSGSYQLEAVRLLWSLQAATTDERMIQSALANFMVDSRISDEKKVQFFSTLWYHSISNSASHLMLDHCLFLYMDLDKNDWLSSLNPKTSKLPSWLKYDVDKFLQMLCAPLLESKGEYDVDDLELNVYYVRILYKVLSSDAQVKSHYKSRAKVLVDVLIERFFFQSVDAIPELPLDLLQFVSLSISLLHHESVSQLTEVFLTIQRTEILDVLRQCLDQARLSEHGKLLTYTSRGIMMACERTSLESTRTLRPVSKWVQFLVDCLKYFHPVFLEVIGPICQCFCSCISSQFEDLSDFLHGNVEKGVYIDTLAVADLLAGLEEVLAVANNYKEKKGHDTSKKTSGSHKHGSASAGSSFGGGGLTATPDSPSSSSPQYNGDPGFLNNVISGVFSVESPLERNANNLERQDILRCFDMSISAAYDVWKRSSYKRSPGEISSAAEKQNDSLSFVLARAKSRARKLLTQLYRLDSLQTLECLIKIFSEDHSDHVIKLIHVIDGSRPKSTIPHLLDSVTMRVSESATAGSDIAEIPFRDVSTVLSITEISQHTALDFVNRYASSLEKDAIEDIWSNCIGFIKDVQSSPMQYKQILPLVLELMSIMAAKVKTLKFGEQKRVRKELTDNFTRLLNYSLSRISGVASANPPSQSTSLTVPGAEDEKPSIPGSPALSVQRLSRPETPMSPATVASYNPRHEELAKVLQDHVIPNLSAIANDDHDKIQTTIGSIMQGIIAPVVKSKKFPKDTPEYVIDVLAVICSTFPQSKLWKPTVADAIFDSRLLAVNYSTMQKWIPVISRWISVSTDQVREYVARISTYSGNSTVLFNWSDQERAAQVNLNRLSLFFLCNKYPGYSSLVGTWTDMIDFKDLSNKLEVLLSNKTQDNRLRFGPQLFTCLRSIFLSVPEAKLSPVLSLTCSYLQEIFLSFVEDPQGYSDIKSLAAACKLLDVLLAIRLEGFQLKEWLFICDNMDAVFKDGPKPDEALVDKIASNIKVTAKMPYHHDTKEVPILLGTRVSSIAKAEDLSWFFQRLALSNYESTYSMRRADSKKCADDLLIDLLEAD